MQPVDSLCKESQKVLLLFSLHLLVLTAAKEEISPTISYEIMQTSKTATNVVLGIILVAVMSFCCLWNCVK